MEQQVHFLMTDPSTARFFVPALLTNNLRRRWQVSSLILDGLALISFLQETVFIVA